VGPDLAYRTPVMTKARAGQTLHPDLLLYGAPVFDSMTDFALDADVVEADLYPHAGVRESVYNVSDRLVRFTGRVAQRRSVQPRHTVRVRGP
jgi:hypothetical protein